MTIARWVCVVMALALPVALRAQSGDAAYCQRLAAAYERYVVKVETGHTMQNGSLGARVALEQCRAGNPAGIPALEKSLRDARVKLPPRS
ncbi:MAG TPA: hypothetical protein VFB13_07360 [Reyranella sp.]|nr:hypothetical protein [Reyranella sp.]